jgi:hypothetical protein
VLALSPLPPLSVRYALFEICFQGSVFVRMSDLILCLLIFSRFTHDDLPCEYVSLGLLNFLQAPMMA